MAKRHRRDLPLTTFMVDVDSLMPGVGDERHIGGSADLYAGRGYELEFSTGSGFEWSVDVRRLSGGVEMMGRLKGEVVLECARCLEDFNHPIELEIFEHAVFALRDEIEEGALDEYLVVGGILDLQPVFRDAICLSLPQKRVCSEECRGICSVCGASLNREQCNCSAKAIDIRLRPLLDIKKKLFGDSGDGDSGV